MNRYNYKNSREYKKYCIIALLKIKKDNILIKVKHELNNLKELFNFKDNIKEYYDLNIHLSNYMPEFYYNRIYDYLEYKHNKFNEMDIDTLKNVLYYLNKAINAINKKINDLYYSLI